MHSCVYLCARRHTIGEQHTHKKKAAKAMGGRKRFCYMIVTTTSVYGLDEFYILVFVRVLFASHSSFARYGELTY